MIETGEQLALVGSFSWFGYAVAGLAFLFGGAAGVLLTKRSGWLLLSAVGVGLCLVAVFLLFLALSPWLSLPPGASGS